MKILIVDDEITSRTFIKSSLKDLGHEVVEASSGEEALKVLESSSPPRMLILDWMMPEISGLDVLRKVRGGSNLLSLYVIMLTAKHNGEDIILAFQEGTNDFISKPVSKVELKSRVEVGIKTIELQGLIEKQTQRLNEAEKMAAIGTMASSIAHEVNNPLSVIKGKCYKLLKLESVSPECVENINKIEQMCDRISHITNGLLMLSRTQSQQDMELCNVRDFFEYSLEVCEDKLVKKGIRINIDLNQFEHSLYARPVELSHVFLNIIKNSIDEVSKLEERWIKISHEESEGFHHYLIMDSGKGISIELQNKILEPFFTTKKSGKGTGLGLSISKKIIESHGGILSLDTSCQNTCFKVSLPKRLSLRAEAPAKLTYLQDLSFVVIEDEKEIIEVYKEYFEFKGLKNVKYFRSLSEFKADKNSNIHVIICDYLLEEGSGLDIFRYVEEKYSKTPLFIMISSLASNGLEKTLRSQGIHYVIPKPLRLERIVKIIEEYYQVKDHKRVS